VTLPDRKAELADLRGWEQEGIGSSSPVREIGSGKVEVVATLQDREVDLACRRTCGESCASSRRKWNDDVFI
jgi:hypothetical protein